MTSLAKIYV